MEDTLGPLVGLTLIFGLPVAGWILSRYMRHRERMEMLRQGIVPPRDYGDWRHARHGAWTPPPWGPAGTPPPQPARFAPDLSDDDSAQAALRGGIRTSMIGLALLIGLSFIGYHSNDGPFGTPSIHPGPWLLGGLIPLFVGLAQIIIALMSGATFGMRPLPPGGPPGGPPPSYARPTSAQPGPPGPPREELARPIQPPDRL